MLGDVLAKLSQNYRASPSAVSTIESNVTWQSTSTGIAYVLRRAPTSMLTSIPFVLFFDSSFFRIISLIYIFY